jgi:hypothetical protein
MPTTKDLMSLPPSFPHCRDVDEDRGCEVEDAVTVCTGRSIEGRGWRELVPAGVVLARVRLARIATRSVSGFPRLIRPAIIILPGKGRRSGTHGIIVRAPYACHRRRQRPSNNGKSIGEVALKWRVAEIAIVQ